MEGVPLFVSHLTLAGRKSPYNPATTRWALDSGAFSILSKHGNWDTWSPQAYTSHVHRYVDELGSLDWVAPQDWMCEPHIVKKTGLSVQEHQRRTVGNFLELRQQLGKLVIPVLQGWALDDYLRCVDLYTDAGVDLLAEPTVGVGSVCRRQRTKEIGTIFTTLADTGLRLHGFGVKAQGLAAYAECLVSADSMAWSYAGRYTPTECGSTTHKNEANCSVYALRWLQDLEGKLCARLLHSLVGV